jgi:hypothetical protein
MDHYKKKSISIPAAQASRQSSAAKIKSSLKQNRAFVFTNLPHYETHIGEWISPH